MQHGFLMFAFFGLAAATVASAQVTQRVSMSSSGAQANETSRIPSASADGRYLAFHSDATNLVDGDTNASRDAFVRDRLNGTTERVSVDSSGVQGDHDSDAYPPAVSADGRYVAFGSNATNLVDGDSNLSCDIFVRDRQNGTTVRVSVDSAGVGGDDDSIQPSISADGRYVAFQSVATNLVAVDTNGWADVFVHDLQNGATTRASVDSTGVQANSLCHDADLSADGRCVVFWSPATNLVAGDSNGLYDYFVHDRTSGTTELVSLDSGGAQGNGLSFGRSALSADGRFVAFESRATNLVAGDTNGRADVFVRDRLTGTTERVSIATGGGEGDIDSGLPVISTDGRFVAFSSGAGNLVPGDTNAATDVFLRDRQSGTTERVSLASDGTQGDRESYVGWVSHDGRLVAFQSVAQNLVPADTNTTSDVFVHDVAGGPDFTSLCFPGTAGVIACPCSNPPTSLGRGCDNSSNTGGAMLNASGAAYLSSDSLVFTTSGEKPTGLSIVAQWSQLHATGLGFGMGVRCATGSLKRLYTKNAVGGSITAPDFGSGDVSVHVRSAALGDPLIAGVSRWYLVYYRDPIVLGGCAPTSTYNATQTGRVSWTP